MKDYLNVMDVPSKENELCKYIIDTFEDRKQYCDKLLNNYLHYQYPRKTVVEKAKKLYVEILNSQKDSTALLKALIDKDNDLYDSADDMEEVITFFKSQVTVFNKGRDLVNEYENEVGFIESDVLTNSFNRIKQIIEMDRPFKNISEIPVQAQAFEKEYAKMLAEKRDESKKIIDRLIQEVSQYKNDRNASLYAKFEENFKDKKVQVEMTDKITILDAITSNLYNAKEKNIEDLVEAGKEPDEIIKVKIVRKANLLTPKQLTKADVDDYVESIRQQLLAELEDTDKIQII